MLTFGSENVPARCFFAMNYLIFVIPIQYFYSIRGKIIFS